MENVDFALVWKEEQEKLFQYAELVPENGTIVEIGTAHGGTAKLFYNATRSRHVRIFTVDISPSQSAYNNLRNTGITIVPKPSSQFAKLWKRKPNRSIDLLYIDGNHNFQHVYEDFVSWTPYLKPNGILVFHDYDPPERGGISHFGVRVCLDTILKSDILSNTKHDYKLLSGVLCKDCKIDLRLIDFYDTFVKIGMGIIKSRQKVFSNSIKRGIKSIQKRKTNIDSLQACYCIDYALKNDFEELANASHRIDEFRKWSEALSILDHGYGTPLFPDNINNMPSPRNITELSQVIAREQLRITLLSMILKSIVRWSI